MRELYTVIGVLLVAGLTLFLLTVDDLTCLKCLTLQHQHRRNRACHEWRAATSLKTLCSAQADFRANDRDGDGVNQFWRADLAGLYALAPVGSPAIKLIDLPVAAADDRPRTDLSPFSGRSANEGYWYRAIRHADEDPKALDPQRFAYCAFPDNPTTAKYMFVIDENNTIYRSIAVGRGGIDVFPTEEELQTSWSRLD